MYFEDREKAGQVLSSKLFEKYRYESCVVMALSDGSVVVGEQIAKSLHCIMTMLLVENISVPGEDVSFGGVSQAGDFTYNGMFSAGEIEAYESEYHGYFEQQKREAFSRINQLLGDGGLIDRELLRDHVVILVADGFENGASVEVAVDYLKPIRLNKLIVATPVASVTAVDRLHVLADELYILDVKENFMGIDHYYDKNTIPSHEDTVAKINQIILNWK